MSEFSFWLLNLPNYDWYKSESRFIKYYCTIWSITIIHKSHAWPQIGNTQVLKVDILRHFCSSIHLYDFIDKYQISFFKKVNIQYVESEFFCQIFVQNPTPTPYNLNWWLVIWVHPSGISLVQDFQIGPWPWYAPIIMRICKCSPRKL